MNAQPSPSARVGIDSSDAGDISLVAVANVVLRYRGLILGTAILLALVVSVVTLVLPRTYTAHATITPQSRRATSTVSGLAAQFGLTLPTGDGGQSPAFYADLLTSRQILGAVVDTRFRFPSDTGAVGGTLVEIFHAKGRTPALRRDAAILKLSKDVQAVTVQRTGVIDVAVTARHPVLAKLIGDRLIQLLNRYNLQTRQSQAAAERRFTERRLDEVRLDLRAAEDRMQNFLQRNRDYRNSPELSFQEERLERGITLQQQLFSSLSESFEQAKIEEVRDTPVITVVESPEAPVRPDRRGLLLNGIMSLVLGAALGLALAIGRAYAANARFLGAREITEFEGLRRQAYDDLLHPWRPLRRAVRGWRSPAQRQSDTSGEPTGG